MFTKAIVKRPAGSMVSGLSSAGLGIPDHALALRQHDAYIEALRLCGLEVIVLDADENYPDSVFVEDTALLTLNGAIITNPGAASRKGETAAIRAEIGKHFGSVEEIRAPGTLDAGDVMMVGRHFFIGLSGRTNPEGAGQAISLLERFGFSGSMVRAGAALHLKTALSYIENNNLLAWEEFRDYPGFRDFNIIAVDLQEKYAANSLWINGCVLVAKGFPKTAALIRKAGYETIELEMSEFRKLDGGLSCLSLRF